MALTDSYLTSTKNLESFLETIKNAKAPERFTIKFLEDLGFKSTNDRLLISVLKALDFLDENSVPTQRYFEYLDDSQSARILAEAIEDAYEDLFRLNKKANEMERSKIVGKLKSLTEGKKSKQVYEKMALTFESLVNLADFDHLNKSTKVEKKEPIKTEKKPIVSNIQETTKSNSIQQNSDFNLKTNEKSLIDSITYRIEINLPASRDKAVYDAIFRSMKEHLL